MATAKLITSERNMERYKTFDEVVKIKHAKEIEKGLYQIEYDLDWKIEGPRFAPTLKEAVTMEELKKKIVMLHRDYYRFSCDVIFSNFTKMTVYAHDSYSERMATVTHARLRHVDIVNRQNNELIEKEKDAKRNTERIRKLYNSVKYSINSDDLIETFTICAVADKYLKDYSNEDIEHIRYFYKLYKHYYGAELLETFATIVCKKIKNRELRIEDIYDKNTKILDEIVKEFQQLKYGPY